MKASKGAVVPSIEGQSSSKEKSTTEKVVIKLKGRPRAHLISKYERTTEMERHHQTES